MNNVLLKQPDEDYQGGHRAMQCRVPCKGLARCLQMSMDASDTASADPVITSGVHQPLQHTFQRGTLSMCDFASVPLLAMVAGGGGGTWLTLAQLQQEELADSNIFDSRVSGCS